MLPILIEFAGQVWEFLIIPLSLLGVVTGLAILTMCIGG